MANSTASLARHVPWQELLGQLGVAVDIVALPASVKCPLCHSGQLHVYPDHALVAQWFSCRGCAFAGDGVELASQVWELSLEATLLRLAEVGINIPAVCLSLDRISAYLRDHIDCRKRFRTFWVEAQERARKAETSTLRGLLNKFGILNRTWQTDWPQRGGQFVGAATKQVVDSALFPASYDPQERLNHKGRTSVRRGGGPGQRRLFTGNGWEELLVVPYYDLPERICGFLFIGRNANPLAGDVLYKSIAAGASQVVPREAGLAMLSMAFAGPSRLLGNDLFVMTDPVLALRLQLRHLRENSVPLPMVATYFDARHESRGVWQLLPPRELTVWGPDIELCIVTARRSNGRLSTIEVSREELRRSMDHLPPAGSLGQLRRQAEPWQAALARILSRLDVRAAEDFLRRLRFNPVELSAFLDTCPQLLASQLRAMVDQPLFYRRVEAYGHVIVQRFDGWYLDPGGERICNAVIRINQVVQIRKANYYKGSIHFAGEDIPFMIPIAEADKVGLLHCLRDQLLAAGTGMLVYSHGWSHRAAEIAMKFHPPEVVTPADRVGWHESQCRFNFPQFSLCLGGEVLHEPGVVSLVDELPAKYMLPPDDLSTSEIEAVSSNLALWPWIACIAWNLLAPAMAKERIGVAVEQKADVETDFAIAKQCGCIQPEPPKATADRLRQWFIEVCDLHGFPAILNAVDGRPRDVLSNWLMEPGPRNCLVAVNWYGSRVLTTHSWTILKQSQSFPALPPEVAIRVLACYLRDVCRRHLNIQRRDDNELLNVLEDISLWLEGAGGNQDVVRAAKRQLIVPSAPTRLVALVELVCRLLQQDGLRLNGVNAPADAAEGSNMCEPATSNVVWVPWNLNALLAKQQAPQLHLGTVTSVLAEGGVLIDLPRSNERQAWPVSAEWLHAAWSHWQKRRTPLA